MARPPPEDNPRVTDLRRYRQEKEKAARRPPPRPPRPPGEGGFLGSNPRAGLILGVVAAILAVVWLLPLILGLARRLG